MDSHFFALMARMKYINRWALMRNAHEENLSEHSLDVAITAHVLVLLHNKTAAQPLSAERAAVLALFHDAPEILTGDMPTPVKYYNEQVRDAYRTVEESACETILSLLPEALRDDYRPLFLPQAADEPLWRFVKAADKICALTKCIAERQAGNMEFEKAAASTLEAIRAMHCPEAEHYLTHFLPGFEKTLDELREI
ncbi:MAG: 5'-deoxynucleotidase [Clostridia bacterium]|nr:5'-deoxynucleotidase [Clostridia bacterium]